MLKFKIENKVHPSVRSDLTKINYLLKAVGLLPLNWSLRFSFPNYLYSVLVLCLLVNFSVSDITKIYAATTHTHISTVTLVSAHFQLLGVKVASWVILVSGIVRYRVYESAFERLIKIEHILFDKINVQVPKHPRITKHFVYAIVIIFTAMTIDYFVLLHNGPKYYRHYLIAFHSSFIYIILSDGHAITIFELIKTRFKQVNDCFTNALRPNKAHDHLSLFIIPQHNLTKTRIKQLSLVHCDLIGTTSQFNSYFSPMLLLEIAVFFIISTCNSYNFFYVLTSTKTIDFYKPTAIYSAYWTIGVFLKLIFLLKSAVSVTKQVEYQTTKNFSFINRSSNELGRYKVLSKRRNYSGLPVGVCSSFGGNSEEFEVNIRPPAVT